MLVADCSRKCMFFYPALRRALICYFCVRFIEIKSLFIKELRMKMLKISLLVLGAVASMVQSDPVVKKPLAPASAAKNPAAKLAEPVRELAVVAKALVVFRRVAALAVVDSKDIVRFFTQETTDNLKKAFASAQSHSAVAQSIIPAIKNLRDFVDAAVTELNKGDAKELKKSLKIELKDDRESVVVDFVFKKEIAPGAAKGSKPVVTASVTVNGLASSEPVYFRNLLTAVLLDDSFLQKNGLLVGAAVGVLGLGALAGALVVNSAKEAAKKEPAKQKKLVDGRNNVQNRDSAEPPFDDLATLPLQRRAVLVEQSFKPGELFTNFIDEKSFAECLAEAMFPESEMLEADDGEVEEPAKNYVVKVDEVLTGKDQENQNLFVMVTESGKVEQVVESLAFAYHAVESSCLSSEARKLRIFILPKGLAGCVDERVLNKYGWTVVVVDDSADSLINSRKAFDDTIKPQLARFKSSVAVFVETEGVVCFASRVWMGDGLMYAYAQSKPPQDLLALVPQARDLLSKRKSLIDHLGRVVQDEFYAQPVLQSCYANSKFDYSQVVVLDYQRALVVLSNLSYYMQEIKDRVFVILNTDLLSNADSISILKLGLPKLMFVDSINYFSTSLNVSPYKNGSKIELPCSALSLGTEDLGCPEDLNKGPSTVEIDMQVSFDSLTGQTAQSVDEAFSVRPQQVRTLVWDALSQFIQETYIQETYSFDSEGRDDDSRLPSPSQGGDSAWGSHGKGCFSGEGVDLSNKWSNFFPSENFEGIFVDRSFGKIGYGFCDSKDGLWGGMYCFNLRNSLEDIKDSLEGFQQVLQKGIVPIFVYDRTKYAKEFTSYEFSNLVSPIMDRMPNIIYVDVNRGSTLHTFEYQVSITKARRYQGHLTKPFQSLDAAIQEVLRLLEVEFADVRQQGPQTVAAASLIPRQGLAQLSSFDDDFSAPQPLEARRSPVVKTALPEPEPKPEPRFEYCCPTSFSFRLAETANKNRNVLGFKNLTNDDETTLDICLGHLQRWIKVEYSTRSLRASVRWKNCHAQGRVFVAAKGGEDAVVQQVLSEHFGIK